LRLHEQSWVYRACLTTSPANRFGRIVTTSTRTWGGRMSGGGRMLSWLPICNRQGGLRWVMPVVVAGLLALAVPAAAFASVAPNTTNDLDCNGWSASYHAARGGGALCTDPIALFNGKATRFNDNGWYVG